MKVELIAVFGRKPYRIVSLGFHILWPVLLGHRVYVCNVAANESASGSGLHYVVYFIIIIAINITASVPTDMSSVMI